MKSVILVTPPNVCINYKSCLVNFSQILLLNQLNQSQFLSQKAFLHKNFHPEQLQNRFLIIRKEILAPIGSSPNYISNKELTGLDRRIINATRYNKTKNLRIYLGCNHTSSQYYKKRTCSLSKSCYMINYALLLRGEAHQLYAVRYFNYISSIQLRYCKEIDKKIFFMYNKQFFYQFSGNISTILKYVEILTAYSQCASTLNNNR